MKSSREMTEDILGRRDEYVALKRKKIRMFTGSSVTVIGFAVIVTGSMMLINNGVMDQHVPIDTNPGILISEEGTASQVPEKKNTERIVNNSSERKVSVYLSSGDVPENTQPEITPEIPYAAQIIVSVSDTPGVSHKSNDAVSVPSVSTVPVDAAEGSKAGSKNSESSVKVPASVKESVTQHKEEVSSVKEQLQTEHLVSSVESMNSESVSDVAVSSAESLSESVVITEPSGSVTNVSVSEANETVPSSESVANGSETVTDYYVYYDLVNDEEKDNSVFEGIDEVVFENRTYRKVPFSFDYEMSKYLEYMPSNTIINDCEVYYVRKMHMIALVKNKSLSLYSLYTEQNINVD